MLYIKLNTKQIINKRKHNQNINKYNKVMNIIRISTVSLII